LACEQVRVLRPGRRIAYLDVDFWELVVALRTKLRDELRLEDGGKGEGNACKNVALP
jgi:hypothetical protein